MASCLGLYIEENIIKYAKVSKDNDIIKIDSFGIKFYDRLSEAIDQVIAETYSYKTPISINVSNEVYNYFYVFNMLSKKDMNSYIKTEFESLCYEKDLNVDTFESRYVLVNDIDDKEKVKAIHISVNKGELARRIEYLNKYKLSSVSPMSLDITNLLEVTKTEGVENVAIVNIEDKTTVTTVIDQKVYDVYTIDDGTSEILRKINEKENSYSKAYEICKNSTIYTTEGKELQYEENIYLDDIMPTLYNIVGQVKKILNESLNKIDKIYITGTASVINNIDIYFQEYLDDVNCEILKPYFIKTIGTEINIKDYIEVNSAIALALQGLGEGLKGINFKKDSLSDKLPEWLTMEIGGSKKEKQDSPLSKLNLKMDFKDELTLAEKRLIKSAVGIVMMIIAYIIFSVVLSTQINDKITETQVSSKNIDTQIALINNDNTKVQDKISEYQTLKQNLEDQDLIASENKRLKYSIPTLLNQIMYIIPKNVQITSITNARETRDGHEAETITISAQSDKYPQLGIFVAKLTQDGILANVKSNESTKENGVVRITIKGELP